jgi:hypothetical protein
VIDVIAVELYENVHCSPLRLSASESLNVRLSDAVPPAVAEPEPRLRVCAATGLAASAKPSMIATIASFVRMRLRAASAAAPSRVILQ